VVTDGRVRDSARAVANHQGSRHTEVIGVTLLALHIIAGLIALVAGGVALYAVKGARVHRKSGMIFV